MKIKNKAQPIFIFIIKVGLKPDFVRKEVLAPNMFLIMSLWQFNKKIKAILNIFRKERNPTIIFNLRVL